MLSNAKRFAAAASAALAIAAGVAPPAAGSAEAPCRAAVAQSTGSEVAIVLEGHYRWPKSTTAHVRLTCHIVQNGLKVVSVSDPLPGHVAALVSDERIGTDPFSICHSIYVTERALTPPLPTDAYSFTNC
jgi:hypothetical protein